MQCHHTFWRSAMNQQKDMHEHEHGGRSQYETACAVCSGRRMLSLAGQDGRTERALRVPGPTTSVWWALGRSRSGSGKAQPYHLCRDKVESSRREAVRSWQGLHIPGSGIMV